MLPPAVGYPRKRAQTRRRLIRAGMKVLARTGASRATVGEIAGVAGVATGTFYNHFPSLDDLVACIAEELASAVEIRMVQLDAVEHDPAARVALGTLQLVTAAEDDPVFAAAFLALIHTLLPFRSRVRTLVDGAIRDGVAAGRFDVEAGTAVTDAVLGAALQSMRSRLLGDGDRSTAADVVRLELRLLGLDRDEVDAVLTRVTSVFQPLEASTATVA